jgi:hypothetical protein
MAVYLIRAGVAGDVKIGLASDPLKRLRSLQTSNTAKLRLMRVLEGGVDVEKALHARFSHLRKAGEWFAFAPGMLAKDIGFPDLPIPTGKRSTFQDTPHGRQRVIHEDIVMSLGGADAIGRRLGVAPWAVVGWDGIAPRYFSAVALMMRDAGYCHVTVGILLDAQDEVLEQNAQDAAEQAKRAAAQISAWQDDSNAKAEVAWVLKNGRDAAWWALRPENVPDDADSAPEALEDAA